jgi:hypothetical protein
MQSPLSPPPLPNLRFVAHRNTPDKVMPFFAILDFVNIFYFLVDTFLKPAKSRRVF